MGYHRAGFDVVGVDHVPQPQYPFQSIEADAMAFLNGQRMDVYDAIHASPPCQGYSRMRHLPWLKGKAYPKLIDAVARELERIGKPWVIENVADAHERMKGSIMLCGTMFGLKCFRHRLFLSSEYLYQPPHPRHTQVIGPGSLLDFRREPGPDGWISLIGKSSKKILDAAREALGVPWMNGHAVSQAIPPAYTEFVGKQLVALLARMEDKDENTGSDHQRHLEGRTGEQRTA